MSIQPLNINTWLQGLPEEIDWQIDTTALESAVRTLLPTENEITTMLDQTGVPNQLAELQQDIQDLPEQIRAIAENVEDTLQEALETLQDSITSLVERIEGLPDEFESAVSEQLKESANQLLDSFHDDIEAHWKMLPTEAEDAMKHALTSGFQSFLDIAAQAEAYFRDAVKNTLNQSEEQLRTHVRQQLADTKDELEIAAIESVQQELVASQSMMIIGSATTSTLSPLLPYIKAADIAADEIKRLLEML